MTKEQIVVLRQQHAQEKKKEALIKKKKAANDNVDMDEVEEDADGTRIKFPKLDQRLKNKSDFNKDLLQPE